MEWAKEKDQKLVILLVDFEKAYDMVNWTFLQEFMNKLSFLKWMDLVDLFIVQGWWIFYGNKW
jgi:hypothetical protein